MTEDHQRALPPSDSSSFELLSVKLGALAIVSHFLDRLGLEALLQRYLPDDDPRVLMPVARTIRLLVLNLCVEREPLYGIGEWAARFDPRARSRARRGRAVVR